ncbi:hypothetical protein Tsubulata_028623 [Turnera subulata]|uniref:Phytocyanin domain-containing protein n=1 Tax=Turnera subulata TaxID=218843 RepID=A0A9Q0FJW6_9ROSI|nr:hypothetical protein Tsubulata_028623 [Turnera subulata]
MVSHFHRITCSAILLLVLCYAQLLSAELYNVGDRGWVPDYDYPRWINGRAFAIGDTLRFLYSKPHNVAEVNEGAAQLCDGSNPIFFSQNYETYVHLNQPGDHFFISTAPGDCQNGMNLRITVAPWTNALPH